MSDLRKKLDKIIYTNGGDNWWKPELFSKNTLNLLPKELEIKETPPEYDKNYNCFIYALGLSNNEDLIKECGGFIYDTFFQKLLDEKLLIYSNNPQDGDYIIYRDLKNYPNMITHIGVIDGDDMVTSKWAWGPLFRHRVLDVPKSYGDDISYVGAITKNRAMELYEQYKKFNIKPEVEK